jgi:aryl-alcohol dehydrogenase-like predicted oxidoreductase
MSGGLKSRRTCYAVRPRSELLFMLSGNCILRLIRILDPMNISPAQFTLRRILKYDAVSCAIPGAKNAAQGTQNAAASDLAPLSAGAPARIRTLYDAGFVIECIRAGSRAGRAGPTTSGAVLDSGGNGV